MSEPENADRAKPWDRQPGESAKAFEAFTLYRDLGPSRSAREVATGLRKSVTLISRWCTAYGWVERGAQWDEEADRRQRERDLIERQRARERMLERHTTAYANIFKVGAAVLAEFDVDNPEHGEAAKAKISELSLGQAVSLLNHAAKGERLARGETQNRVTRQEALAWVEGFVDLALAYLPMDSHEAFLRDVDEKLGLAGMASE